MKIGSAGPVVAAVALGIGVLVFQAHAQAPTGATTMFADAKPGDLRVIATAAIKSPLEASHDAAEKAIGRRIVLQFGSARGNLRTALLAGQSFDVAVLVPDVNEELIKAGKAAAGISSFARVDSAVGQRGNVPPVDVSTPAALKKALLGAKWIWWADTGTSSPTVNKVFDTLDIRAALKPKHDMTGNAPLAAGEYQLYIRAQSEILENKELKLLGPIPSELLVPTILGAVISVNPSDAALAKAYVAFLKSSEADAALKASGMRRP